MNLNEPDRAALAAAEEVRIETRSPAGDEHSTIIWVVVDGSDVFIRSVNGSGARWYREATSGAPAAIVVDRSRRIPVSISRADDPASIERCSAALTAKYAADPALRLMLRPDTLSTTLRVLASA